jgi:hypothetical protein
MFEDRVEGGEELAHRGGERELGGFSRRAQAQLKGAQRGLMTGPR